MLALSFFRNSLMALVLSVIAVPVAVADDLVRITNLSDISVPNWITGDPAISQTMLVCIYHTSAATYGIKAVGDGPGFFLKNGTATLAYNVTWNDGGAGNPAGGTTSTLVDNVKLSGVSGARIETDAPTSSDDCSGGSSPTAQLTIGISQVNLEAAPDGTYSGVLTLYLTAS
jgi:hypothetical protein